MTPAKAGEVTDNPRLGNPGGFVWAPMKDAFRLHTLLTVSLALGCANQLPAKPAVTVATTTEQQAEKGMVARPGLTAAEVDEAVRKASQLTPKMTVAQVEQIVGSLKVGEKSGSLHDMLSALPLLPGIKVTASNGICRFDFTSNDKGRFLFTSWALLPGAQPSQ